MVEQVNPIPIKSQYGPYYDNEGLSLYLSSSPCVLKFGSPHDLKLVNDPFHPNNPLFSRLETYIKTFFGPNNTPVYVFDDHNMALFGWCEAFLEGRLEAGATLKHYDAHSDNGKPPNKFLEKKDFLRGWWTLAEAATYACSIPCGHFIQPAIHMGLVGNFDWFPDHYRGLPKHRFDRFSQLMYRTVGTAYSLYCYGFSSPPPERKIVDIDLDYFNRMASQETTRETLAVMRTDMLDAGVITVATSPVYIDPQRAVNLAQQLLSE